MSHAELKARRRSDYGYHLDYRTRWSDNDMYDHMNNSVYSFLFDSIINTYLITHCGRHPPTSPEIGLAVHSSIDFFGSITYPCVAELGLRVRKLGTSSVTYEIGVFEKGMEDVRAVGEFVHVFVERDGMKTRKEGMSGEVRAGLERLLLGEGVEKARKRAKL